MELGRKQQRGRQCVQKHEAYVAFSVDAEDDVIFEALAHPDDRVLVSIDDQLLMTAVDSIHLTSGSFDVLVDEFDVDATTHFHAQADGTLTWTDTVMNVDTTTLTYEGGDITLDVDTLDIDTATFTFDLEDIYDHGRETTYSVSVTDFTLNAASHIEIQPANMHLSSTSTVLVRQYPP